MIGTLSLNTQRRNDPGFCLIGLVHWMAAGFFMMGIAPTIPAAIPMSSIFVGGSGNTWTTSGNWSPIGVPNNSVGILYQANITNVGSNVSLGSGITISGLAIGATDTLNLNAKSNLIIATTGPSLVANSGQIVFNSVPANAATLVLSGGTVDLNGGGNLLLNSDGSNSTANKIVGGGGTTDRLVNSDNTIKGTGQIGGGGLGLTNQSRGTIDANVNGQPLSIILGTQNATNAGTLQASNGGILSVTGGTITNTGGTIQALTGSTVAVSGATIIGGTVETVGTGMLNLNSNSQISDGALTNASGGTINVIGTNNVLGGAVSNAGRILISGGSDLTLLGGGSNTYINSGTIAISSTSTGSSGSLILSGGTVSLNGGGKITLTDQATNRITGDGTSLLKNVDNTISGSGEIGHDSLKFINQGSVIANGLNGLLITGGSLGYTNSGLFKVTLGSELKGTGLFTNFANNTLTGGTYQVFGTFVFDNAAIHTNAATILLSGPSSVITDQNGHDALMQFATNSSAGNFAVQNGHNLTTPSSFTNAGFLTIGGGTTFQVGSLDRLDYTQTGGTSTVNGILAVSVANINGGLLTGNGTINGNVNNSGTISHDNSPATLTITGNYFQSASGALHTAINGTDTGLFDVIKVGGLATFNGYLDVSFGYAASVGDSFQIVTFATSTGTYDPANIHITGLASGLTVSEIYHAHDLTLVIGTVPEPASIILMTLGLVGIGLYVVRHLSNFRKSFTDSAQGSAPNSAIR